MNDPTMIATYIKSYSANLEGLREFVELIKPFLDENENRVVKEHALALKPLVLAYKSELLDQKDPQKTKLLDELHQIFDGEIIVEHDKEENSVKLRIKGDSKAIDEAFRTLRKATRQKTLLYHSSLITLVSSVEWFFSQILHYYFDKYPEAAGLNERSMTLSELKSFNSVDDAQNYLIDSKVEEILRSGFEDWIKTLKSKLKLSLGYLDKVEDQMVEVYQRRNILVPFQKIKVVLF
jgi:hypothetical protein